MKWRKQYADPKGDAEISDRVAKRFDPEKDLAVQSYKDDSDINVLMRRFGVTGELPRAATEPFYGDFTDAPDFRTSLHMIREAEEAFEALPSRVRRRFGDDPGELIAFLQDPDNRDEAVRLGLMQPPPRVEAPEAPESEPASEDPAL